MKLLGIDFETTGLEPKTDRIIEVGAVLWDWDLRQPVILRNDLILPDLELAPDWTSPVGISGKLLKAHHAPERYVFVHLNELIERADAAVAHNGNTFDRLFYQETCTRLKIPVIDKVWVDTCVDLEYPDELTTRKLIYLAAEHGFLNPFAHRAVFDVLTMFKVLEAYDIEKVLYSAKQPTVEVQAVVSYDDREKAKEMGFRARYEGGKFQAWVKTLKQHKVEAERARCPFPVRAWTPADQMSFGYTTGR